MRLVARLFGWAWLSIIGWRLRRALVRAWSASVPAECGQLHVFGDSLSDTGNVHHMLEWLRTKSVTPSPPYYQGRFSDGPNWIDRFAAALGFASVSAWEGGTNYAHGGAQTGFGLSTLIAMVPNLGEQIEFFARMRRAFDPQAWIVLLGGHNNLFATVHGRDTIEWETALAHLMTHLERLYELGGRRFIVPRLMSLDRTPEAPVDRRDFLRQWTEAFNESLAERLEGFRSAHEDICLVSPHLGRAVDALLDNAASHGFTNTTTRCYDETSGKVPGDPGEHFWWDECHPTTRVHEAMARCALEAVSQSSPLVTAHPAVLGSR